MEETRPSAVWPRPFDKPQLNTKFTQDLPGCAINRYSDDFSANVRSHGFSHGPESSHSVNVPGANILDDVELFDQRTSFEFETSASMIAATEKNSQFFTPSMSLMYGASSSGMDLNKLSNLIPSMDLGSTTPTTSHSLLSSRFALNEEGLLSTDVHHCPMCDYVTKSKTNLKTHVRRHTGEKPYLCSYCSKRFVAKSELNMHVKIHTGQKLFQCKFCQYQATQKAKLRVHERRQHGEEISGALQGLAQLQD